MEIADQFSPRHVLKSWMGIKKRLKNTGGRGRPRMYVESLIMSMAKSNHGTQTELVSTWGMHSNPPVPPLVRSEYRRSRKEAHN